MSYNVIAIKKLRQTRQTMVTISSK